MFGKKSHLLVAFMLLLNSLFRSVCIASDEELAVVEEDIDEFANERLVQDQKEERCTSGSTGFINAHYILVSTMDGKVTALDVAKSGDVVWSVDVDEVPLMSSSISSKKLVANGVLYMLVPSLDGSLYIFNVERNALSPIYLGAGVHIMVGNDEVAGGIFITSTGIDPLSGKIRYRCTAGNCMQYEQETGEQSSFTLIMRRSTQTARAADPLTGSERWNLSVGEYDVSLVSSGNSFTAKELKMPSHIRFLLQPPDGIVSAINSCGEVMWNHQLQSPIARVWQLFQGQLFEVSLFSSDTMDALADYDGNDRSHNLKHEAPFYFGTVNSEPYIIPSERLRQRQKNSALSSRFSSHPQQIDSLPPSNYFYLESMKIGDLIKRSYHADDSEKVDYMRDSIDWKQSSSSCNVKDVMIVSGSKELQKVEDNFVHGDHGWYIIQPIPKSYCQRTPFFSPKDPGGETVKNKLCKRRNVFEGLKKIVREPVSGWWKVFALFLILIASSLATVIVLYSQLFRRRRLLTERSGENNFDDDNSSLTDEPVSENLDSGRKSMGTTISQTSPYSFTSKFLEDFVPEKWLGRGGYGNVFMCRNRLDERSYAIKRIAVSNTAAAIDRMKREARAMARLDHPGIIRYFHTWMEKPPPGWQQLKDKEIFKNFSTTTQSSENSTVENALEEINLHYKDGYCQEMKGQTLSGKHFFEDEFRSKFGVDAGDDLRNDENDFSWANDTFSACSTSSPSKFGIAASIDAVVDDSSFGVIFLNEESEVDHEKTSKKKGLIDEPSDPFEPHAILVTSMADLKTCKATKNYVYLYIQMELCKELTLHNWLLGNNRKSDRNIEKMRMWFAELVSAIDYIHGQGLIHRDLKPQNIFFSKDNFLKIGDLGLATNYMGTQKAVECEDRIRPNISHTGNVGTRLYMSPEQLAGKPYNEKIDVFSLGLVFVELIIPFKTVMERHRILSEIQKGSIPLQLNYLSAENEIIRWLTSSDPDLRPSAREIVESGYLEKDMKYLNSPCHRERSSSINHCQR